MGPFKMGADHSSLHRAWGASLLRAGGWAHRGAPWSTRPLPFPGWGASGFGAHSQLRVTFVSGARGCSLGDVCGLFGPLAGDRHQWRSSWSWYQLDPLTGCVAGASVSSKLRVLASPFQILWVPEASDLSLPEEPVIQGLVGAERCRAVNCG